MKERLRVIGGSWDQCTMEIEEDAVFIQTPECGKAGASDDLPAFITETYRRYTIDGRNSVFLAPVGLSDEQVTELIRKRGARCEGLTARAVPIPKAADTDPETTHG